MAQAPAVSQVAGPLAASPGQVTSSDPGLTIVSLSWQPSNWSVDLKVGLPLVGLLLIVVAAVVIIKLIYWGKPNSVMEIDQAAIGIGESKISFRPNTTDRQVAYAIWVELSTRKIGISIDLEDDVILEIYDSWYNYFSVTRDLIKTISVSKVRGNSTRKIINLSIDVLNGGLRPHLTKWQARYRHWYDRQIKTLDKRSDQDSVIDPQSLQKKFPQYTELSTELMKVNTRLIAYRNSMQSLVFDQQK